MPVKAVTGGQGRVRGRRAGAQQGTGGTPSPPAADPSFGTAHGSATVSGVGGTVAAGSNPDWFVDSVAGSDSNNGTSLATPFATIAKVNSMVVANPTQKFVALKRGSYWRELLGADADGSPNSWPSGSKVTDYGAGVIPVLDGANVAVNGSFSLTGGQTKTYQINWANSMPSFTGKEFFSAWENGTRLIRATSIANCEATAGSCYAPDPTGTSPQLIYIHATNDSNVSTNGKTYEITARLYGIGFPGVSGVTLASAVDGTVGLRARRGGSNNGSVECGLDATIKGVVSQEGRLHNFLFASGTATDCYSWRVEPASNGTGFVAFANDATGLSAAFVRCYHIGNTAAVSPDGETGFYAHSSGGVGTQHALVSFTDSYTYYCFAAFDGLATAFNLTRGGAENVVLAIGSGADSVAADDCYFKMNSPNTGQEILSPAGAAGSLTNSRVEMASQFRAGFLGHGSWDISHNTIYCSFTSYSYTIDYDNTSTINFHHNICVNTHNVLGSTVASTGLTLGTWDNNVYKDDGGGTFWTLNGAAFDSGLAAWKTHSGKETNSITSDPLFNGSPSAGDFTLQSGSPAIALAAGATNDAAKGRWSMPVWATVISNLGSW
jgi:hypothetical protein